MSIKVEKTQKKNELKLEFTIEAAKFDEAIKKVYNKSAKYFNIPGFRKGKAPMAMVEKTYGTEIFYEDAFNEVVPNEFEKETKENNIEAVGKPEIDIVQIEKGKDLIFTAIVQIKPEVKLGKYKGIQIKKIEYNVSDDDIENELTHMAERNARLVAIEDAPVENGNITIIDFDGYVDDEAFEGGKAEGYELKIGSNTFIPGFEEQIIGMKIEEEKDIKVKFPEEYHAENLKGKDAVFKVKLHEIKKKELPQINDEFAKDTSEFDTLEELKSDIKAKKEAENEKRAKYETEDEIIKAVSEQVDIEIPQAMIEMETDNMQREIEQNLQYQGMKLEQYLKYMGKDLESFRKEYEEQARITVKNRLVLDAIIKEENIEVTDEELETKLKEMAEVYKKTIDELKVNEGFMKYITDSIKNQKVLEFLNSNVKIK